MKIPADPADVLVIDDNLYIRRCLTDLLEHEGHSVAAAAHGWEALEYLRQSGPPRVIFLDLAMPEMDGWDFLHQRRHRPELRDVPVVVFSAVADLRGPDPRGLGAAEVLHKPFDFAKVLDAGAVLRGACGRARCGGAGHRLRRRAAQRRVEDRGPREPDAAPSRPTGVSREASGRRPPRGPRRRAGA